MTPGSIVFWEGFTLHDGCHADKLLIVLNDGKSKPYLVLKTTSKQHRKPGTEGCHHAKGCYFIPENRDWFKKDTWVLFNEPYELNRDDFLRACLKERTAKKEGELKPILLQSIKNCFIKSDDCSEHYASLLK